MHRDSRGSTRYFSVRGPYKTPKRPYKNNNIYRDEIHVPVACDWHDKARYVLRKLSDIKADITPYHIQQGIYINFSTRVNIYDVAKFMVWATNKRYVVGGKWLDYVSDTAETSGVNEYAIYKYEQPPKKNLFNFIRRWLKERLI